MTEFERQQAKVRKERSKGKSPVAAERRELQKIKDAEEARTLYLTEVGSWKLQISEFRQTNNLKAIRHGHHGFYQSEVRHGYLRNYS